MAARLLDELCEEASVLAGFGMPEDADGEAAAGRLDRLDGAVLGTRASAEPVAQAAEALVVVRLDGRALAEQAAERRAGIELHFVIGEDAGRVLVRAVADDIRQVLHEVAA